jgi:Fe-S-cluster containining protein
MVSPCDICKGACCESIVLPLAFKDEDTQRWYALHGKDERGAVRLECKCSALKHGKCTIYDTRPEVCRVFAVGSPECRNSVTQRRPFRSAQIFKLMEAGHGKA